MAFGAKANGDSRAERPAGGFVDLSDPTTLFAAVCFLAAASLLAVRHCRGRYRAAGADDDADDSDDDDDDTGEPKPICHLPKKGRGSSFSAGRGGKRCQRVSTVDSDEDDFDNQRF